MNIVRVKPDTPEWDALTEFADQCSWVAGKHLADMLRGRRFKGWESAFAAMDNERVIGFCTLLETDYYPENRYSPWVSCLFVDEESRSRRVSQRLIEATMTYAGLQGFAVAYIPSDITGLYEKYGFQKIDELRNYAGEMDNIFAKPIPKPSEGQACALRPND